MKTPPAPTKKRKIPAQDLQRKKTRPILARPAEKFLDPKTKKTKDPSTRDWEGLVHNLQVHQIELEMQNEELRRAQVEIEESQRRYSDLYNFAPVGYFTLDPKGRILEANLTAAKLLGVEKSFLIKKPLSNFIASDFQDAFFLHRQKVFKTGLQHSCEMKLRKRDEAGSLYISLESVGVRDGNGNLEKCHSTMSDITERKYVEEELRKAKDELEGKVQRRTKQLVRMSEVLQARIKERRKDEERIAWLASFPELSPNPVVEADFQGGVSYLNPVAKGLFPDLRERKIDHPWLADWKSLTEKFRNGKAQTHIREVLIDERYYHQSMHYLKETGRIRIFGRDITDRKRMEQEYKKSEEKARLLIKYAPSMIYELDFQGPKFKTVNEAMCRLLGYTREELLAMNPLDLVDEKSKRLFEGRIRKRLAGEKVSESLECRGKVKDGREIWTLLNIDFTEKNGRLDGAVVVAHDITDRKRMEETLRKSRDELELRVQERTTEVRQQAELLDVARDAIIFEELDGTVRLWSQGAVEMYGWSRDEVVGKILRHILQTDYPVPRPEIMAALVRDWHWEGQLTHTRKDGIKIKVLSRWTLKKDSQGGPERILIINHDITEKLKLEEQLRRAQKLEAMGTLAGGIAHDFNNLLQPILLNVDLALMDIEEGKLPSLHNLQLAKEGANRGAQLVKQIITLSRQKEHPRHPIEITPVTNETIKFLESTIPKNIELRHESLPAPAVILGDPTHIHQVLMNLCSNGIYAMQEKGGILEVNLSRGDIDSKHPVSREGLKPGPYLLLTVKDHGCGMDRETQEKAFDPFFTTKPGGKGTGLGLSVVHGIVKSYQGAITLESEVGVGTTVNVFLPLLPGYWEPESTLHPLPRGKERILIVDDEEAQVHSMQAILERLGYRVTGKTDPLEALETFRSQPKDFDLLVTDKVMPHLPGDKLARECLAIRPDLPIVLCTGFSEEIDEEKARAIGVRDFIMKPFAAKEIANVVRCCLTANS